MLVVGDESKEIVSLLTRLHKNAANFLPETWFYVTDWGQLGTAKPIGHFLLSDYVLNVIEKRQNYHATEHNNVIE